MYHPWGLSLIFFTCLFHIQNDQQNLVNAHVTCKLRCTTISFNYFTLLSRFMVHAKLCIFVAKCCRYLPFWTTHPWLFHQAHINCMMSCLHITLFSWHMLCALKISNKKNYFTHPHLCECYTNPSWLETHISLRIISNCIKPLNQ